MKFLRQWCNQNLKEVPQYVTVVFNIGDITSKTSYRETNITKKKINLSSIVITDAKLALELKKDLEFCFHFYGKTTIIVRSPVHGYACILASLYYFDKNFTVHFQPTFTFSKYE